MTSPTDILKDTFNTVSNGYDGKPLRFFPNSAEHLASLLDLKGDERVLDLATGTGHAAMAMAKKLPRGHVTGVDFSEGMLSRAGAKAEALGIGNVSFREGDMQALPFTPASFDAAVCAFGIFFAEDMACQLSRMASLVTDGGLVAICSFREDYFEPLRSMFVKRLSEYGVPQPPQPWKLIASPAGCRAFFEQEGLRDIRVEEKNMGYLLSSETEWWDIIWNAGFRRMVTRLSPADQERFRREHLEAVAALAGKEGIRLDIGVLYTLGRKEGRNPWQEESPEKRSL